MGEPRVGSRRATGPALRRRRENEHQSGPIYTQEQARNQAELGDGVDDGSPTRFSIDAVVPLWDGPACLALLWDGPAIASDSSAKTESERRPVLRVVLCDVSLARFKALVAGFLGRSWLDGGGRNSAG